MKALFLILLVANLAVGGYAWYASDPANPDSALVNQQLNAEKIRVTGPRPMVLPSRPRVACLEWGSFAVAELKQPLAALEALKLGNRVTFRQAQVLFSFWVYIPPVGSQAELDRKLVELQKMGIQDYRAVESPGPTKNAISFGIFKTGEAANNRLEKLRQAGVRSARVISREQRVTQTTFVVRQPDVALAATLAALCLQFPGSELKAVDCPS